SRGHLSAHRARRSAARAVGFFLRTPRPHFARPLRRASPRLRLRRFAAGFSLCLYELKAHSLESVRVEVVRNPFWRSVVSFTPHKRGGQPDAFRSTRCHFAPCATRRECLGSTSHMREKSESEALA